MGEICRGWRRRIGSHAVAWGFASSLCIAIAIYSVIPAFGMSQTTDEIVFGHTSYVLLEYPMEGLWDYGKVKPAEGMEEPPPFDVTWSGNKRRYQAKFEIVDSKLWLKEMTGKINGDRVKDDEIIGGQRFPIFAKWFTGKIHLEVGGYDIKTDESIYVIVVQIEKGAVTKTEYAERMKRVWTWNGLPKSSKPTASN